MDTYSEPITPKRRHLSLAEKRGIVEETLVEGASVARVAQAHGLNANLVFNWRRLYQKGLLRRGGAAKLLPVKVAAESSSVLTAGWDKAGHARTCSGMIHIQLRHAQVRIEGGIDAGLVRVVLECLDDDRTA